MTEFEEKRKPHGSSFFNGLALGVVIGAAAFFLFGTKKGRKVKKRFLEKGSSFLKELEKAEEELKEKKEEIKKQTSKIKEKLAAKKQKLEKKVEEIKNQAEEIKQEVKQVTAKAGKRFFRKNGRSLG